MYSPGIRSTIGGSVSPFQNEDPLGKALADSFEQGAANAVQGVANWYQRASADQAGISDDLLRLMAGGVRNTTNAWKAATAEQEGIHDDILRGVGWTAGKGLQVLDAGSYYGGKLGGNIARMVGVDARIGGALGNVGGDLLAGGLIAKGAKIGKATKALRTLDAVESGGILKPGPGATRGFKTGGVVQDTITTIKAGGKTQSKLIRASNQLLPEINEAGEQTFKLINRGDQQKLRNTFESILDNDPSLADDLLHDRVDRLVLGNIVDGKGDSRRIQGLHEFIRTRDPNKLSFPSRSKSNAANLDRLKRMKPPEDGSVEKLFRELIKDPEVADAMMLKWRKQQMAGFNQVQEAARRSGLSQEQELLELITGKKTKPSAKFLEQFDAGHWFATKSEAHPLIPGDKQWVGESKLYNHPTSGHAARIENRIANQTAKADVKHDLNPFAAKEIGVPRTWEEDIIFWLDREFNTGLVPDWKELGQVYMTWAEDIPWNMPKHQVKKRFKEFQKQLSQDPNYMKMRDVEAYRGFKDDFSGLSSKADAARRKVTKGEPMTMQEHRENLKILREGADPETLLIKRSKGQ